jgi:thiol-disulfide isomerase/thioredoxin
MQGLTKKITGVTFYPCCFKIFKAKFMRFILLIFLLGFILPKVFTQQTINLSLKNNLACQHRVTRELHKRSANNGTPMPIPLSNNDSMRLWVTQRLELLYRQSDTIGLLVASGITTQNRLFAVADENQDGDLGNDPVHYIQPNKDKYDFACNLPLICISGLPLLNANNNDTLCLRITPVKDDYEQYWFTNSFEVANYKATIRLAFIRDYYLSGDYKHKGTDYEIRAILPAESYNLYATELRFPTRNHIFLGVMRKGGTDKDILKEHMLGKINQFQGEDAPFFKTGNHYLRFDTIDLPHDRVVITIRDTPPPAMSTPPNLKDAMAQHLGTAIQQDLLLPGRPAIVHFSGSWCKPCHMALPAFKKLYNKYKGQYQFATLLAEKNLAIAQATYKKEKIPWPGFYEQVSCKEKDCLQQRLSVSMFPTYAIIGKNGDLVQQVNSVEELEEALQKMAKDAKWKAGLPKL